VLSSYREIPNDSRPKMIIVIASKMKRKTGRGLPLHGLLGSLSHQNSRQAGPRDQVRQAGIIGTVRKAG
jgi:hypothetical protein